MKITATMLLPLLALAGCGNEGPPSDEGPIYHPVPGCEGIDHAPCDVRTSACQTRLMAVAACLRSATDTTLPPIAVIPEADFAAMLASNAAMATPDPHLARWEWALTSLGLIASGALSVDTMVTASAKSILGLYRHKTKDIQIIDHGASFDQAQASRTLVHELVHALQDREVDLTQYQATFSTSDDDRLASTALVEGEARMHETRYQASLLGLDPLQVDWMRRFDNRIDADENYLLMQPSPYTVTSSTFPYEWGARYAYDTWAVGGQGALHARFLAPPVTTRLLMASTDAALDPEPAPARLPAPAPPDGWTAVDGATMGAWNLFLMLAKVGLNGPQEAQDLALHWRGDGLWIYDGPPAGGAAGAPAGAMVWLIDVDDPTTASRVNLLAARLGLTIRAAGTRVVLATTTNGSALDWAFAP